MTAGFGSVAFTAESHTGASRSVPGTSSSAVSAQVNTPASASAATG